MSTRRRSRPIPLLVILTWMCACSIPVAAQSVTRETDGQGGTVESLDLGLFTLVDPGGRAVGGTLVRMTRPGGERDILLVLWYGGHDDAGILNDVPLEVLLDQEQIRAPIFGPVTRGRDADGVVMETTAYRLSPDQLRKVGRAAAVRLHVIAAGEGLQCTLRAENLRQWQAFVAEVVGAL